MPTSPASSMVVTYRDSGGAATTGQVKILLIGTTKGLGNKTTVLQFNSNAAPPASGVTAAVGASGSRHNNRLLTISFASN